MVLLRKKNQIILKYEFLEDDYLEFNLPIKLKNGPFEGTIFSFDLVYFKNGKMSWSTIVHESKIPETELLKNKEFQLQQAQILLALNQEKGSKYSTYEEENKTDGITDIEESSS